ncbi:GNAT family N-acetyltransferase [Pseudomonas piscis]|uniref:GNAT family N-acetyltransferase n=1 Tax=Pseudomonas piscis TaxID=2614538 RepID=UPI0004CF5EB3|nr:GNAT family N-acetyltransferase [Pseudomonas piscis]
MPIKDFNYQPYLSGRSLRLEPLTKCHFDEMLDAASDPKIWEGHPSTDRFKREVFEPYFASLLATEKALAVIDVQQEKVIGSSSYYTPPDQCDSIAIGFTFLVREHWGGGSNRELKHLMVEHAFKLYDRVFLHIAPTNIRSQKATMKLGAEHLYDAELNLSSAPKLWKCYALTRAQWQHPERSEELL